VEVEDTVSGYFPVAKFLIAHVERSGPTIVGTYTFQFLHSLGNNKNLWLRFYIKLLTVITYGYLHYFFFCKNKLYSSKIRGKI
jgi:hypothetical protein